MLKGGSTFVREDEAALSKASKPFPPKARRLGIIISVVLLALAALPVVLEGMGISVRIGPWLSMLITLPITLIAMGFMGFLRDGIAVNVISGAAVLFAMTMGYALEFEPGNEERALFLRAACPAITVAILTFFWLGLRTSLRDLHYMIAEGQSMQDIMLRYQQANLIRKKGGKPAMLPDGKVVDANEVVGRPGFRTPPKEKQAGSKTEKKKRKKPKLR